METLKARRIWTVVFTDWKGPQIPAKIPVPSKTFNHVKQENKIAYDNVKFKQYLFTNQALQKVLENSNAKRLNTPEKAQ